MKRRVLLLILGLALVLALPLGAQAALINVDVFANYTNPSTGGAPYVTYVGSLGSADVQFGSTTGFNWHPFGLGSFGAEITGRLDIPAAGNYAFSLISDDGSMLYINNALVINNGGGHGPSGPIVSVAIPAGCLPFKVEFYEDFGGASGVDLNLPQGVSYQAVPLPPAVVFFGSGLLGLVGWRRFRKG